MATVSQDERVSMSDHVIVTKTCIELKHTTLFACKRLYRGIAIIEYIARGWPNNLEGGLTISRVV